jgi:Fanconi anemia group M protein
MIHDIFSKPSSQKSISNSKIPITIDYREKNSLVPAKLFKNFQINFKELKIGDYLIKDTIIERKTIIDFSNSMVNGRLKKQLEEIKQYPNYLLIIEGNINKIKNIHKNAIKGFILSILTNYKVPIIFTNDEEETAEYLTILANQQKKENKINPTKKCLTKEERQLFILQSFPNIGPKKSKELLNKFKTLKNIFNEKEENLKPILNKNSFEFISILNSKYN